MNASAPFGATLQSIVKPSAAARCIKTYIEITGEKCDAFARRHAQQAKPRSDVDHQVWKPAGWGCWATTVIGWTPLGFAATLGLACGRAGYIFGSGSTTVAIWSIFGSA